MGGVKNDNGKAPFHLIPAVWLAEFVKVWQIGEGKYGAYNWLKGMAYSRLIAAHDRHWNKWLRGQNEDQEDGQHHLISVAWCACVLWCYQALGLGTDDRPGELMDLQPTRIFESGEEFLEYLESFDHDD